MSLNDERLLIERISRWPNCEKAFAFVLKTWGSSPLPAGSMLAISDSGKFEGSLSGGCVENSVIEESAEVIRSGVPKRLFYGVSDDRAWEIGLPCGGSIEILILKPNEPEFDQVLNDTTPFTLMANLATGEIGGQFNAGVGAASGGFTGGSQEVDEDLLDLLGVGGQVEGGRLDSGVQLDYRRGKLRLQQLLHLERLSFQ